MSNPTLVSIRCRGCGRLVALGTGQPQHRVFCGEACSREPSPLSPNEERDDLIEMLARIQKWGSVKIAVNFEISRQRVEQILKDRGIGG